MTPETKSGSVQPSSLGRRGIALLEGLSAERLEALARICAWRNYRKQNIARIDRAPTHADMASQVSTYREQVTRELSALAKAGIVLREGRALLIRDVKRLETLVEEVKSTS